MICGAPFVLAVASLCMCIVIFQHRYLVLCSPKHLGQAIPQCTVFTETSHQYFGVTRYSSLDSLSSMHFVTCVEYLLAVCSWYGVCSPCCLQYAVDQPRRSTDHDALGVPRKGGTAAEGATT